MPDSDSTVIAEVLKGAPDKFRIIVEKYENVLFDLAIRMTQNREEAEDIVQAAFVKMYGKLEDYDSRRKFLTWAYTITLNTARNHLRKKRLIKFFSLDFSGNNEDGGNKFREPHDKGVHEAAEHDIFSGELQKTIQNLPVSLREPFVLHYIMEEDVKTVAEALSLSGNAVKLRLLRARKFLRGHLALKFPEYAKDENSAPTGAAL